MLATLVAAVPVQSGLTNPGFEESTQGWEPEVVMVGNRCVVPFHEADNATYGPMEGECFLSLECRDGPDVPAETWQVVFLEAGETLSGYAAFDARDYMPYNDYASVEIHDADGELLAEPWYADVASVGDEGESAWTYWEWTAPADGVYVLVYQVANGYDPGVPSYALFDAAEVANPQIHVGLDIKPGANANVVNPRSKGVIPVAILGSDLLDVAEIDQETIEFAGAPASEKGRSGRLGSFEDVDGDGYADLVVHFRTEALSLPDGDGEATLTAELLDGTSIIGTDSVVVVPRKKK